MEQIPTTEPVAVCDLETEIPEVSVSYGFLKFLAKECLPFEKHSMSILETAENLEETPERIIRALETIAMMNAVEYRREDDIVTIIRKSPNQVTPGAYHRLFPKAGPINPGEKKEQTDTLFDPTD